MIVVEARNVNDAYFKGVCRVLASGLREQSRNGPVLVAPTPVTTVYHRPAERVLMDAERDANPFFHLMESVWMLAGRRDATWLDRYVRDFSARYAKMNGEAHGAYGHRWRYLFDRDQLLEASALMLADPTSRRAVIAMWDPDEDLGTDSLDIPCNTQMFLRARRDHIDERWLLDTTVLCRSNDAVWGAYGANAVHFSVAAEVLAALSGMHLGVYYQVSNNLHVYTDRMRKAPRSPDPCWYTSGRISASPIIPDTVSDPQERRQLATVLLSECQDICHQLEHSQTALVGTVVTNEWLAQTVLPMARAHALWKSGNREAALSAVDRVQSTDWRMAAYHWMKRRATP